jgi:PAS domain S-box-containing protein
MGNLTSRYQIFKQTINSFLIGLLIIACYIFTKLLYDKYDINFDSVIFIFRDDPSLLIFLLFPVILAISTYFISFSFYKKISGLENRIDEEEKTSNAILEFVEKLNKGETESELKLTDVNDNLGKAILNLRNTIKKNQEDEAKRREEDRQRNWAAEGLARFGEILRKNNDDLHELSYNVISNLVKYVNANQGGLFLINDDDENNKFIEQMACYAYDRRKYADRRYQFGEGLIGNCILEGNTINLKNVPDEYLYITSGLGKAKPRNLLIVPLKVNEEILGTVEIASFNEFREFEIQFIEKVAESIGSTILNVRNNIKTSKLLIDSRQQAEALKSQEEEIRQNLEELQATQEEAKRQAEEFISFTNSVNHTLIRAEYSTDGILLYANTRFIEKLGYSKNSEVEGQHISTFIHIKDREWFNNIWNSLAVGGKHFEGYMKHITKDGQDLWTLATYTCIRNDDRSVKKILFLALDTTEFKKQSLDFKGQIDALNRATIKAEFFTSGSVLDGNRKFRDIFKYSIVEIYEKNIFDLIHREEKNAFDENWSKIVKGKPIEGTFKMVTRDHDVIWLQGTFSPVYDMYNEISKIIFIGNDVTYEKMIEIKAREQAEILQKHEETLRQNENILKEKLRETREAVRQQYKEIEKIKNRNEKILEGANDAIIISNQYSNIEFVNKAACNLFDITKDEITGKSVANLFTPEQIKQNEFLNKYAKAGIDKIIGIRHDIEIINKKGNKIPVSIILSEAIVDNEYIYTAFIQIK